MAYCSARSNGRIMVDISIDCTESHEKHEGSMNKLGRKTKAEGGIKDDKQQKKNTFYSKI